MIKSIKNNQEWIVQFASKDDPWVPIDEQRFVHEKLDSEYYEFDDQGHFCDRTIFPEVVEAVINRLQLPGRHP